MDTGNTYKLLDLLVKEGSGSELQLNVQHAFEEAGNEEDVTAERRTRDMIYKLVEATSIIFLSKC